MTQAPNIFRAQGSYTFRKWYPGASLDLRLLVVSVLAYSCRSLTMTPIAPTAVLGVAVSAGMSMGSRHDDLCTRDGYGSAMLIQVYGNPAPQGSKKVLGRTKTGKTILGEASDNTTPWRADVMTAARAVLDDLGWPMPWDTPVLARMVFSFARPRAHYRTGKNAHILRDDAPSRPIAKNLGDLAKLARSTEDALTAAGVWVDDRLVVDYLRLAKVYCNEDPEALDRPGCVIILGPLVGSIPVEGPLPRKGS